MTVRQMSEQDYRNHTSEQDYRNHTSEQNIHLGLMVKQYPGQ